MKRATNKGTVMATVGLVGLLLVQFGVDVDMDWLGTTAGLVCTILVLWGVMNDSTTNGIDNPFKPKEPITPKSVDQLHYINMKGTKGECKN